MSGGGAVVVVGAINADLVVEAPRLPRPGETVVGGDVHRHGGGKGANAAVAAARAGASVRLVAAVGRDEHGTAALEDLRREGVDAAGVAVLDGRPTGVALIVVDPEGENQIAVAPGANAALEPEHVRRGLAGAACAVVSTEVPEDAVTAAVEAAAAAGVPCVLNPAPVVPAVARLLRHGPVLTPNATELRDLADGEDVAGRARALAGRSGAPVVVTLGGDGALVALPDAEPVHLPPHPATVRDTTGAGDTFNGVLGARLAAGEDVLAAARVAVAAASLSVAAAGARGGMPDTAAIEAALRG